MNILLVGSGGREHALAWKMVRSPLTTRLVCAPGNPGIASLCQTRPVKADDIAGLVALAEEMAADLVVIGPETSIAGGLADRLAEAEIACFGPSAAAGRLETSKAFAKDFARRNGLPTGRFAVCDDAASAKAALRANTAPYVIKADGLAAGKGVVIAPDLAAAEHEIDDIFDGRFGVAGSRVLVEEFLHGEVVSLFALCDGEAVVMIGGAQDHKRAFDGDVGPNTGGMGAYAPAPVLNPATVERICQRLIAPTVAAMAAAETPYRGVLFCEAMITAEGPKLIEFNARFGDPEAQVLMFAMRSDLVPYLAATAKGELGSLPPIEWTGDAVICVVIAAEGYPGPPTAGDVIDGAELDYGPDVVVFHAGTARRGDGALVSAGGRVLNVCARAATLTEAATRAYDVVGRIRLRGAFHRTDIGWRGLAAERGLATPPPSG